MHCQESQDYRHTTRHTKPRPGSQYSPITALTDLVVVHVPDHLVLVLRCQRHVDGSSDVEGDELAWLWCGESKNRGS